MQIEYKIWEGPHAISKTELIQIGEDGWELVGAFAMPSDRAHPRMYHYYFKRFAHINP